MVKGSPPRLVADPGEVGNVPRVPFLVLPDPMALFATRARRMEALAAGNAFEAFLHFMVVVAQGQDAAVTQTRRVPAFVAAASDRPPLERGAILAEPDWRDILHGLASQLSATAMPCEAASALRSLVVRAADDLAAFAYRVLDRRFTSEEGPEALFLIAALQAEWTRRAGAVRTSAITPRETLACPVCGAIPLASLVCGAGDRQGLRFLVCSLCASQWHHVRIKCTSCGTTKGIAYHGIAGQNGPAKAETCSECKAYSKIIYAERDAEAEPLADDIGSLALDILMNDDGWRRTYPNPFLAPPGLSS